MATIGQHKPLLLEQIQRENPGIDRIKQVLQTYEDLSLNDLRGTISDEMYTMLLDEVRSPEEKALWQKCTNNSWETLPTTTLDNVEYAINAINEALNNTSIYLSRYPNGPKCSDANSLRSTLLTKKEEMESRKRIIIDGEREQKDWNILDTGNYLALRNYLNRYPNSIHKDELDDYMWTNTKNAPILRNFERYLQDLPMGRHANEANKAIDDFSEWNEVKRSGDMFLVDDYRDNHPDSPFKREIDSLYYDLVDKTLAEMQNNPASFNYDDVKRLIEADIFTQYELIDRNLMTEQSWETLQNKDAVKQELPDLKEFVMNSVEGTAPEATDVFLFGTPGTGKTCMLMGLVGANGNTFERADSRLTYTLNLQQYGGNYAAALQSYIYEGITPGSTFGSFVTTFHGNIQETDTKGNSIDHPINLVEMSGEEFARRIADNEDATVSFEDMGSGATKVMSNENRKIFFIIIDPTVTSVKIQYIENVFDSEGNVIDQRIRTKRIDQRIILAKFVSLFTLPENQELMKRVDAIHFIVTKSDILEKNGDRNTAAAELLSSVYGATVTALKQYCIGTKRINITTDYEPRVFTFSLGQFYLGDVFKFTPSETLNILDAIRQISGGKKKKSWWDTLKDKLG